MRKFRRQKSVLNLLFYKIFFAHCSTRPFKSACLKFEFLGNLNNLTGADDILQHAGSHIFTI